MKKNSHAMHIWFWQRMITPHMAELVTELARQGCNVTYVAEEQMAADRAEQGWSVPRLPGVRLKLATTVTDIKTLAASAPGDSIHICQGIRANGLVKYAQSILKTRGLRQWVIMETVDDAGWRGLIKRVEYHRLFAVWQNSLQGVLAIGQATPKWLTDRGMPNNRVFPFAYFLRDLDQKKHLVDKTDRPFRFVFVGQFIERKRLDLFLDALQRIDLFNFELTVIGTGPLEAELKVMAEKILPNRLNWIGLLPQDLVPKEIAKADCLVLPSRYDGWGAVVSESLMMGTPVICSNTCGSAGVVQASGKGGVFKCEDRQKLISTLEHILSGERIKKQDRSDLANWAKCLGAELGASYLMNILQYDKKVGERPVPPWRVAS